MLPRGKAHQVGRGEGGVMDKRREVLEKLFDKGYYQAVGCQCNRTEEIDQALTALDKLEKEKMLGYVGGDREVTEDNVLKANYDDGYNIAKAEIRKAVRGL